ncbi:hypothetical protein Trydic_g6143 [Trypoxylus dichotomus]
MSSTNKEIQPHPKTRASPLDFRNTDLVSRLLAATPPYLYNIPMVPNSYFFSEMLKSFVQAKSESTRIQTTHQHTRRARKRSWTQSRATDYYHTEPPKKEKCDVNLNDWSTKAAYDMKRLERPLELTTDKHPLGTISKIPDNENKLPICYPTVDKNDQHVIPHPQNHPGLFPGISQNLNQDTNLMLPPPPPLWYPPLYPPPYGLDPLHFFIDLRVSGHIYDGKNNKDNIASSSNASNNDLKINDQKSASLEPAHEGFKQTRHTSAFRVPVPSSSKNIPMNLSNRFTETKETKTKFDVKSMGFEKTTNKTSTNYIMKNISKMYKDLHALSCKPEPVDAAESNRDNARDGDKELTEEEKRVRDLRALIGLELVVDYMKHTKPKTSNQSHSEESLTDDLDSTSGSPSVEVVVCHDEISQEI